MKNIAIIGSGLGGLIAGNLIARRGHKVTLFESHTAPGGYTAGFRRKGYYFESGTLSFESSGVLFKALDDLGLRDKIHFTKARSRWVSPYFDFLVESYESFKLEIHRGFPAEKSGPRRLFRRTRSDRRRFPAVHRRTQPQPVFRAGGCPGRPPLCHQRRTDL